ncbi:GTPase [Pasteurellaceae bacterium Macca]|nr:GTPase [Pasteurellaceae bacterium Macca]
MFACIAIFYSVIAIHDIPYEIAKKRNHPHLEAIHYAGWVSLFTLHVIWPFLWIWATLWDSEKGWNRQDHQQLLKLQDMSNQIPQLEHQHQQLEQEVSALRQQVAQLSAQLAQLNVKQEA